MSATQQAEHRVSTGGARPDFVATLDHLGALRVSGEDAGSFLQGQLSSDVLGLVPGAATLGAYCTPRGRVIASLLLWRDGTDFLAAVSRDLAPFVQKQLSKYVLRSKVRVLDASVSIVLAGAAGPHAQRALSAAPGSTARLADGRVMHALPAAEAPRILGGIDLAGAAQWRWMDIRAGLPWITSATQDQLVPQMANLELIGGVSFDKGCYTGQEIVARTQHLGMVKRRMYLANVAAPAQAGDALYADDLGAQVSGIVINAEPSPEGGFDCLASMHVSSRERSTVHLKSPDGPALRFLPLPYAVP